MSVEGLLGTDRVFAADLHALRPHPGQAASAANIRAVLADSPIVASHRGPEDTRVQDAVLAALRAAGHGAARDTLEHAARRRRARARVRDRQPGRHCPTAAWSPTATSTARRSRYVLDFLAIAAADVASIAERRTDRFLDPARSHGLPAVPRRTTRASTRAT